MEHTQTPTKLIVLVSVRRPDAGFCQWLDGLFAVMAAAEKPAPVVQALLVDDGSGRAYAPVFEEIRQKHGCAVLHHAVHLGRGRALKTGLNHCLLQWPDAVGIVCIDAEGQYAPKDILACVRVFCARPKALVVGSRDFAGGGVLRKSKVENGLIRMLLRLLCGIRVQEARAGLRCLPMGLAPVAAALPGEHADFETNLLLAAKQNGFPVQDVPLKTCYRGVGHPSQGTAWADIGRICLVFAKYLFSGLSSSLIDLALFALFVYLFKKVTPMYAILVGTVCARVLSSLYNYLLNRHLVFKGRGGFATVAKYYLLVLSTMLFSGAAVSLVHYLWPVWEVGIKAVVDALLFFLNFQLQRIWVFRQKKMPKTQ